MLWCRRVFALPGITLLIVFVLVRPQEFVPLLQRLPFLHLFTALAVVGYVIDVRLRRLQPVATNTLPWVIAFFIWSVISTAAAAPDTLVAWILFLIILFALYGTVAHGIQRFRSFQLVVGVLALTTVFLAGICAHQGLSPLQCIGGIEIDGAIDGEPDGRECVEAVDCRGGDAERAEQQPADRVLTHLDREHEADHRKRDQCHTKGHAHHQVGVPRRARIRLIATEEPEQHIDG